MLNLQAVHRTGSKNKFGGVNGRDGRSKDWRFDSRWQVRDNVVVRGRKASAGVRTKVRTRARAEGEDGARWR